MVIADTFGIVSRGDVGIPSPPPRSILGPGSTLDVRAWRVTESLLPRLLVNASRRQGPAVQRNLFKRRVRMAFLHLMRAQPDLGLDSQWVVWIRPAKQAKLSSHMNYMDIQGQLELALRRLDTQ